MLLPWIPQEPKFFDMFDETAELIVKAAEVLVDLVEHWEHPARRFEQLGQLEQRCDRCVEKLLSTLSADGVSLGSAISTRRHAGPEHPAVLPPLAAGAASVPREPGF
jgi:hypothetical protein